MLTCERLKWSADKLPIQLIIENKTNCVSINSSKPNQNIRLSIDKTAIQEILKIKDIDDINEHLQNLKSLTVS